MAAHSTAATPPPAAPTPAVARAALRTSRSASASPSRPSKCRRRVSRSRTGTCGAMSPTASAIQRSAALGLNSWPSPRARGRRDQPAEQLAPPARLEVVGGQRGDGLAEVASSGGPAAARSRAGSGLDGAGLRCRHRRSSPSPVGLAHVARPAAVAPRPSAGAEARRLRVEQVRARPHADRGGDRRPGGAPRAVAPVRRTRGRSARRCAPPPAGCGGARGNSARSGTRRPASAAP